MTFRIIIRLNQKTTCKEVINLNFWRRRFQKDMLRPKCIARQNDKPRLLEEEISKRYASTKYTARQNDKPRLLEEEISKRYASTKYTAKQNDKPRLLEEEVSKRYASTEMLFLIKRQVYNIFQSF